MTATLHALASAHGIVLEHHDIWGNAHRVPDDSLRAILAAMHVRTDDESAIASAVEEVKRARYRQPLPPMTVVRSHTRPWFLRVHLAASLLACRFEWRVVSEEGSEHLRAVTPPPADACERVDVGGEPRVALDLPLDVALPDGYHEVALCADGAPVARGTLAVAPAACYRPQSMREGRRLWGVAAQLYGLRSERNWGIGDFGDLAALVGRSATVGADVVGVNPLHALFPRDPERASPYGPSSRVFLNVFYLDVQAIAEFDRCPAAQELVGTGAFQAKLGELRASELVDYAGVAAVKLPVLELLYAQARRDGGAGDAADAGDFKRAGGEVLRRYALFEALQEYWRARDSTVWGWPAWPEAYRDPAADAVVRFADEHAERIDFHAWLQYQASRQWADVARQARESGLAIGVYVDLAVSVDRGGAEAWAHQDLYAIAASVGAPPDSFNAKGQDWGLPPMIPQRLSDAGYAPFLATLRASMRDAGALRIDHVMGLMRLYWVPAGAEPAQGAYVRYPFEDLRGLLALESQRHRCLVIGEDLGTVPDEVRSALAADDILSYCVLLFERGNAGDFKPPDAYPEAALAVASTHDLPTLAGWWEGHDIRLRAEHGQLAQDADIEVQLEERVHDRGLLLEALAGVGLLPAEASPDPSAVPALTPPLALAVQAYLARTPSALMVVQLEDIYGVREQANLPGTVDAHPNWRRKLPIGSDAKHTQRDERLATLASRIADERRWGRP
ncbi:MAG: 4-alpha-glucanotransferase [Burkholderiales bacterium]|nr:4-alpha-glucanotransferase [Burkholderiales bacterium]